MSNTQADKNNEKFQQIVDTRNTQTEKSGDKKLTKLHLIRLIERIEREDKFTLTQIFPERLGEEKWSNRAGSTQSFTKPGKNQMDGAIASLVFLLTKFQSLEWE